MRLKIDSWFSASRIFARLVIIRSKEVSHAHDILRRNFNDYVDVPGSCAVAHNNSSAIEPVSMYANRELRFEAWLEMSRLESSRFVMNDRLRFSRATFRPQELANRGHEPQHAHSQWR